MKETSLFSSFLSSKEALFKAADGPPVCTREYRVNRYIRFPIVEDGLRKDVNLKPSSVIVVKWLYESKSNPIAIRIELDGKPIETNFSGKKLHDWLSKNAG
jgi:hypothetical protein